jgi:hypothetical protein
MIDALTPEQEAKIPQYVEKYTAMGLSTAQETQENAERIFKEFQEKVLKMATPAPVKLMKSPTACNLAIYSSEYSKQGKAFDPVAEKIKMIYPYFDCQFWAGWASFYDFMRNELGIEYPPEYDVFRQCITFGMVYPTPDCCYVCQPPTVLKKNANGLHCEDGPAVSYGGDNEIYALNGVVMDKKYVLTPAEKIEPLDVLKESNVEVRRELIRKVGLEVIFDRLPNKMLDKRDNYELYSVSLSTEVPDARYLKMVNPSIGCFHVEGVAPETNTVAEALNWRNQNMFQDADVLT